MDNGVDAILTERGTTHGEYTDHAKCTQAILRAMMAEKNWSTLPDIVKESVHMVAHKLGRIATGDPMVPDHWDDIAGYARLVSQRIATPIAPYQPDAYEAMARGWQVSRSEAKNQFYKMALDARDKRKSSDLPLTKQAIPDPIALDTNVPLLGELVEGQRASGQGVIGTLLGVGAVSRDFYVRTNSGVVERLVHCHPAPKPGTPEDGGQHARQEIDEEAV